MSGIDPTATSTTTTADLLDTAHRSGIITADEFSKGTSLLAAAAATQTPLPLKLMMRFLQNEWKQQTADTIITARALQDTYQRIRTRYAQGGSPEQSHSDVHERRTVTSTPKKYSVSFRRQSTLHVIPEPEHHHHTHMTPQSQSPEACCVVM